MNTESQKFEHMSLQDQLQYVNEKGVIQKKYNSVSSNEHVSFGKYYYAYEIQNGYGWRFARGSSKEASDESYQQWIAKRS